MNERFMPDFSNLSLITVPHTYMVAQKKLCCAIIAIIGANL